MPPHCTRRLFGSPCAVGFGGVRVGYGHVGIPLLNRKMLVKLIGLHVTDQTKVCNCSRTPVLAVHKESACKGGFCLELFGMDYDCIGVVST